jgi:hypothetical protein
MASPEYPSHHVRNNLYISHFLSTWNARLFEFGAVLFISTIFPGTLFPASIYALTRSASVVLFSTAIGHLIDRSERLFLIRLSISKLSSLVNAIFFLLTPLTVLVCIELVSLVSLFVLIPINQIDQFQSDREQQQQHHVFCYGCCYTLDTLLSTHCLQNSHWHSFRFLLVSRSSRPSSIPYPLNVTGSSLYRRTTPMTYKVTYSYSNL